MANQSLSQGIQYNDQGFVFSSDNAYPGSTQLDSTVGDGVDRIERSQSAKSGSGGAAGDFTTLIGQGGASSKINFARDLGGGLFSALIVEPAYTATGQILIGGTGALTFSGSMSTVPVQIPNQVASGTYQTAPTTVDITNSFILNQTTASITVRFANPTDTTAGKYIFCENKGTVTVTVQGATGSPPTLSLAAQTAGFIFWDGTVWAPSGSGAAVAASGPLGAVQLSNGAGVFTDDNTNFLYDTVNHRLKLATLLGFSDNTATIGSSAVRHASVTANTFSVFAASGDANPTSKLSDTSVILGAGGATAPDLRLTRSALKQLQLDDTAGGSVPGIAYTTNALMLGVYESGTRAFGPGIDSFIFGNVVLGQGLPTLANSSSFTGQGVYIGNNTGHLLTVENSSVLIGSGVASIATTMNSCTGVGASAFSAANNLISCAAIGGACQGLSGVTLTVGVGNGALQAATTGGDHTTAIGGQSLTNIATNGFDLTGCGYHTGTGATAANRCTYIGSGATSTGAGTHSGRTAIGIDSSGNAATATVDNGLFFPATLVSVSPSTNSRIYLSTFFNTSTGQMGPGQGYVTTSVTAYGNQSGNSVTSGLRGTFYGTVAGAAITTQNDVTAIGFGALQHSTGAGNTAIGSGAATAATTDTGIVAIGFNAANAMNGGGNSVAVGRNALALTVASNTHVAVGDSALGAANAGNNNTSVGGSSLFALASGSNNCAYGASSLLHATSCSDNISIGFNTLGNTTGPGSQNVAIGTQALQASAASGNVAVGYQAATALVSSVNTVAVGFQCLTTLSTASQCTGVGVTALQANNAGDCTAVGYAALQANTTSGNTAVGSNSLISNVGGGSNCAVGVSSLRTNISSSNCTAVGSSALFSSTGASNTAVGSAAGFSVSLGSSLTCVGDHAMGAATTATTSVAVGAFSISGATFTGSDCVGIGYQSLKAATGASQCTSVGSNSMLANSSGTKNSAYGAGALAANVTNSQNCAFGHNSLNLSTSDNNSAFGQLSMGATTSGTQCSAFGQNALSGQNAGSRNNAFGCISMTGLTSGTDNCAFGQSSLNNASFNGSSNVGVGNACGSTLTTGSNNTLIGANANVSAGAAASRIAIGQGASASVDNGLFYPTTLASLAAAVTVQFNAGTGQMGPLVSSARFKKHIMDMSPEVDSSKVYDLRPVVYNYSVEHLKDTPREFGLIAEEVQSLFPQIVPLDADGLAFSVNYDRVTVLLVAEMKKLRDRIAVLEDKA